MADSNKIFSDYLIDRKTLKTKLSFWRNIALVIIALFVIQFASQKNYSNEFSKEYIARVKIEGEIFENSHRDKVLRQLAQNQKVKAVVLHVDSLGGVLYSGENLYHLIKKISIKKPVVTVIESYATSAAYMISLASEQIFARQSSVTGSIGAWVMVPDVTKLADKIGVKMNMLKSGSLKAQPQPFESMNEKVKQYTQDSVNEAYQIFLSLVKKERKLPESSIKEISTGATFLGQKALDLGLIDQIGAEDEALEYLYVKRKIDKALQVKDISVKIHESKLSKIISNFQDVQQSLYKVKSYLGKFLNFFIL